MLSGFSRKPSWKRLKFGRSGHVLHQGLHPRRERRARGLAALGEVAPRSPARSRASTLIRSATSLRVLLMLVCSSTLLREVLLSWMLYFDGEQVLELGAVVAGGAAHQRHARGVEEELVFAAAP